MKDLLYSDVEDSLRDSVRRLLEASTSPTVLLERIESADVYDAKVWASLSTDLGVSGLAVAEADGGHGATWRETAVVAEELGRSLTPTPFLSSAVLATALAQAVGDREVLARLADGSRTGAVLVPVTTAPGGWPGGVAVTDGRLRGTIRAVVDALDEPIYYVAATDGAGAHAIYRVDGTAAGISVDTPISFDLTRPVYDITIDVALGDGDGAARAMAEAEAADSALAGALTAGAAMVAAELLGLAERCLEMTVQYLKTRYQFGRALGTNQALKHRAADQWAKISQARAAVRYAAACLADGDPDAAVAVSVAKAYTSVAAVRTAEECVQLHGGIGFTWEHPAHLYLKRAKADAIAFGSARVHYALLADLVDLPAT